MHIKKSVLLTMAALSTTAWAQTCTPTATAPYLNINGTTAWAAKSSAAVNTGTRVVLGPQPGGGSWSWSGCGTSGTSREQTIDLVNSGTTVSTCTANATYTNSCGAKTIQQFNFTIFPAMAANAGRFIMTDQFGYLSTAQKIAVLRRPMAGYDANGPTFWPQELKVINSVTGATVFSGWPTEWHAGATDDSSGDRVWYFDFSTLKDPGTYEIVDTLGERSARFEIGDNVYRNVLIQAVRMFYYQRLGQARSVSNAGLKWTDDAGNLKAGQDPQARRFLDQTNPATERDVRGGWADAGDFNKYTNSLAAYAQDLLEAYRQAPTVFTDDFNIPESYNGIPDILDEAKWGLDYLKRIQNSDGSVLSIIGAGGASPPSSGTAPSYWGEPNTSATLSTAAAFAHGAKVLGSLNNPSLSSYVADLQARAISAYNWAVNNPNVIFHSPPGLGVVDQETDDAGRAKLKLYAAINLYALTGNTAYRAVVDATYTSSSMFTEWCLSGFCAGDSRHMLYYTALPGATAATANAIRSRYTDLMNRTQYYDTWATIDTQKDPYRAQIGSYTWSSNGVKSNAGTLFLNEAYYGLSTRSATQTTNAAVDYLHYLHGVNPMGKVYLSNMNSFGAENSVNQIWHSWFADGTAWDDAKTSLYGPAPGFLVGGPAGEQYSWQTGCPTLSPECGSAPPSPPYGQPPQKSYKDFNTGWPLNSWPVAEPSDGYQTAYIMLLSRFVK